MKKKMQTTTKGLIELIWGGEKIKRFKMYTYKKKLSAKFKCGIAIKKKKKNCGKCNLIDESSKQLNTFPLFLEQQNSIHPMSGVLGVKAKHTHP